MEINKPVAIIILFIINVMLLFLFVMPKYQESYDLQVELAQKKAEYDSQSDYRSRLMGILQDIDMRKEAVEKIDIALPAHFSSASVLHFFQKESTQNQLVIKSITFSDVLPEANEVRSESSGLKRIDFTVNLAGSYRGLKNLLVSLDKSGRLFQVENISFTAPVAFIDPTSPPVLAQSESYNFKLEIKTYIY